ncbi:MAG: glycoside hydrolase family 3 C-terminal domain-containing protein [Clostridia bacterium]|nr:glycoside hydrolase family 3 C-terminal domain-containing protein [Clostridia bacterium]
MKYKASDFTLEEKFQLMTGYAHGMQTNGLQGKLPFLWLSDGPNGLRYLDTSTGVMFTRKSISYPAPVVMANSWSTDVLYKTGVGIADECVENDVAVLLAPGVNIKRTPLCGRNLEYYSEDPYLAGMLAKAFIEGVQSKGVGTSLKHFCCNNREFDRMAQNSEVDERSLREIYLRPFEIALTAKPWTVMCSYNPVNGVYMSENKKYLKGLLREELGFDGLIVSDWGAVHNRVKALKATLDLEMPYNAQSERILSEAYAAGQFTEEELDFCVENVLRLCEKFEEAKPLRKKTLSDEQRLSISKAAALEGIVLLKNEGNVLPIQKNARVVIVGDLAESPVYNGGGSSRVENKHKITPLAECLREALPKAQIDMESGQYFTGAQTRDDAVMFMHTFKKAIEKAEAADMAIVVVGNNNAVEIEATDRYTLRLTPLCEEMIKRISAYNRNTVVVIEAGSAIDMRAWIDGVAGVVFAGFGGEAINDALADILSGKVCPSGKLTETFPLSVEDTPSKTELGNSFTERYAEGIMVGYRWYDSRNLDVLFPFGYGLSYAQFEYSDLRLEKQSETDYLLRYKIKNVSNVDGKEVSQVYVQDVFSMVERPKKELVAFSKDLIRAGEEKEITVQLSADSFAYYSVSFDKWYVENGKFKVFVGASSRDIRLEASLVIQLDEATQQSTR